MLNGTFGSVEHMGKETIITNCPDFLEPPNPFSFKTDAKLKWKHNNFRISVDWSAWLNFIDLTVMEIGHGNSVFSLVALLLNSDKYKLTWPLVR